MLLSHEELQNMAQMDVIDADPETLADISRIEVDIKKAVSTRISDYIQKVKNPFLVKVDDYVVKIGYSDCEETLNERMEQYIKKIAAIK